MSTKGSHGYKKRFQDNKGKKENWKEEKIESFVEMK